MDGYRLLEIIILALFAGFLILRLRSVLGRRTGNERPPIDPFRTRDQAQPAEQPGNVIRLPQGGESAPVKGTEEERPPVWAGYAEKDSALAAVLERIAESDPAFTAKSFVEGAKLAYEMIIDGFAKGDKASLKNLLSREVYEGFARAISERESAGHRIDQRFVGIDKASILTAELDGSRASITVDFDTKDDGQVTLRDRDSLEQVRVPIEGLPELIAGKLAEPWKSPKLG